MMKTLKYFILVSFGLLLTCHSIHPQDLSQFEPIAHYTLINTNVDSLGNYDTITLVNTLYQGQEGVYSNGIFSGNENNNSQIITPVFDELNFEKLAITLQFKRTLGATNKPVIIVGGTWRWFGAQLIPRDSSISLIYNSAHKYPINIKTIEPDTWYDLTLIYQDSTGYLYIDNNLIDSIDFVIKASDNDKLILNLHGGNGTTFDGNWRNLIVYKGKTGSSAYLNQFSDILYIFPNPNNGNFIIHFNNSTFQNIQLININGKVLYTKTYTTLSPEHKTKISGIKPGIYILKVIDKNGKTYTNKILIN